jgi:hypothetical protein
MTCPVGAMRLARAGPFAIARPHRAARLAVPRVRAQRLPQYLHALHRQHRHRRQSGA